MISVLLEDDIPIINNSLEVKKLSFFVTYFTAAFYIFGMQTLGF